MATARLQPEPHKSLLTPRPEEYYEISLEDNPSQPARSGSVEQPCFKNLFHEGMFVVVIALCGASPVVLQRATVVITASIEKALHMTQSEVTWITAGAGCVLLSKCIVLYAYH